MAVSFVAKGVFANGTAALSVAQPAGIIAGDLLLLMVESANQVIAVPTGYTEVVNSPQFTGTAALAGGVRLAVFFKIAVAAEPAVAVADSGDHTTAIIAAYRGVSPINPIVASIGSVQATATTAMVFPGVTTTVDGCAVVMVVAKDLDAASTATMSSALTNAGLGGITQRHDQTIAGGVGGGLVFFDAQDDFAGATGASTGTCTTASTHAYLTVALRPRVLLGAKLSQGVTLGTHLTSATVGGVSGPNGFVSYRSQELFRSETGASWTKPVTPGLGGSQFSSAAFGAGRYVLSVAGQLVFYSSNTETWTSAPAIPGGGTYGSSVSFVNGLFFGLNANATIGDIVTSPDGINWTRRTLPSSRLWGTPQFVLGQYVLTMSGGFLLTSPDGFTWTERVLPAGVTWNAEVGASANVALLGGQFVDTICRSTDLINWTVLASTPVPAAQTWRGFVFTNNQFVRYTGNAETGLSVSPDGINWSPRTVRGMGSNSSGPRRTRNYFFALNGSEVFVSADYINWSSAGAVTNVDPSMPHGDSVLLFDGQTTSVSIVPMPGALATASATLATPAIVLLQASASVQAAASATLTSVIPNIDGTASGVSSASAGLSTQILLAAALVVDITATRTNLFESTRWVGVIFAQDRFLALTKNTDFSPVAATSPDGVNWVDNPVTHLGDWDYLTFANGIYLAIDRFTGSIIRSTDGVTWTFHLEPAGVTNCIFTGMTFGNGLFMATGPLNFCITSPDGITWTSRTLPASDQWTGPVFGKGLFVTMARNLATPFTSPDAITWTPGPSLTAYPPNWTALCFTNGAFFAIGIGNSRSFDGLTWEPFTLPSTQAAPRSMAHTEGVLVVLLPGSSSFGASEDMGLTWTTKPYPPQTAGVTWSGIAVGNGGYFVIVGASNPVGSKGSGRIFPAPRAKGSLTTQIRANATALAQSTVSGTLAGGAQFVAAATAQFSITGAGLATQIRMFTAAGGNAASSANLTTVIQAAASSAALASGNAGLTTAIRLNAAPLAQAGAGPAALTTAITLAASSSALATSSANLTVGARLASATSAQAFSASSLSTQILLAGASSATATTTLVLAGGSAQFFSASSATGTASASLTAGARFNAASSALATTSAALNTQIRLSAASSATATTSAALTTQVRMTSAVSGLSTASANLLVGVLLNASAASLSTASANLTVGVLLSAAASSVASTSAGLSTQILLAASASATAGASAGMSGTALLTASATGTSTSSANLTVGARLSASAASQSDASANLNTQIRLAAAAAGLANFSANLNTRIELNGNATSTVSAAGALTARVQLVGQSAATALTSASLGTAILLSSSSSARAIVQASLNSVGADLAASAAAAALAQGTLRVPPSAYATRTVAAESRSLTVPAQHNGVAVAAESRALIVPARQSKLDVAGVARTLTVTADARLSSKV